jgi:hypothetical protein
MKELIELLETAYRDMVAVKKDPKYIFDVSHWYYKEGSRCAVCIAGAVMAKTLNIQDKSIVLPCDLEDVWAYKLRLIEGIRSWDTYQIQDNISLLKWEQPDLDIMYKGVSKQKLSAGHNTSVKKLITNLKKHYGQRADA